MSDDMAQLIPDPPFADRPVEFSVEEFYVNNVPTVHPADRQWRLVVKLSRFPSKGDAQDAGYLIGRMLTGEDRTSV